MNRSHNFTWYAVLRLGSYNSTHIYRGLNRIYTQNLQIVHFSCLFWMKCCVQIKMFVFLGVFFGGGGGCSFIFSITWVKMGQYKLTLALGEPLNTYPSFHHSALELPWWPLCCFVSVPSRRWSPRWAVLETTGSRLLSLSLPSFECLHVKLSVPLWEQL